MSETRSRQIAFPLEYHAELVGDFRDGRRPTDARSRSPIAAAIGIFLLLQAALGSWRLAAVAFLVLPLAMVGCVLAAGRGGVRRLARVARGLRRGLRDQQCGPASRCSATTSNSSGTKASPSGRRSSNAVRASDASRSWRPRVASRPRPPAVRPLGRRGGPGDRASDGGRDRSAVSSRRPLLVLFVVPNLYLRFGSTPARRARRRPRSSSSRSRSSRCRRADAKEEERCGCVQEGSPRRSSSSALALPGCSRPAAQDEGRLERRGDRGAVEGSDVARVTLSEDAAGRLDITTAPITELGRRGHGAAIPYAAVLYDPNGDTWAYTSPEPLVFVRAPITWSPIDGDRARPVRRSAGRHRRS